MALHTSRFKGLLLGCFCWAGTLNAQSLNFNVLAGSPPSAGCEDGSGSAASFAAPVSAAVDAAGNIYIADANCHVIRRVTPVGVVSTFAGLAGMSGSQDGMGSAARFTTPYGIAVAPSGTIYVSEFINHTIRTITPGGLTATLAGSPGVFGSDDGMGATARFYYPSGIAVDAAGDAYVADYFNSTIRKITPAGMVTTFAGQVGNCDAVDGVGTAAAFCYPSGIAVNRASGELFVADVEAGTIRKIAPDTTVTTYAGQPFTYGSDDGPGASATFGYAWNLAVDPSGIVYVVDEGNYTVRKIVPDAQTTVSTPAGLAGSPGSADGTGSAARFRAIEGIAADTAGNVWVTDWANRTLRRMTPGGEVTTVAGIPPSVGGFDGSGTAAQFDTPSGVAWIGGSAYVADTNNCTIRKISGAGVVTTLAGTPGVCGTVDGSGSAAQIYYPLAITTGSDGNLYVTQRLSSGAIRKVTPAGEVTTLAGGLRLPEGIAADGAGNLYVAETRNNRIMKIDLSGNATLLAGCATGCSGSSDGQGSAARFYWPAGIAATSAGIVYVADSRNHTLRRIDTAGNVTTIAGFAGTIGSADGPAADARFNRPAGAAVDAAGNVFIADTRNHTLRKLDTAGQVTTIAGTASVSGGAFGTGTAARFYNPTGLTVDGQGGLIVADKSNHAIRVSSAAPIPDAAVIDAPTGALGDPRQLDVLPQNATSWQWTLVRRPAGSNANPITPTIRNPTFTPDVVELYQFRVVASGPSGQASSLVELAAYDGNCDTPVIASSSGNQDLCTGEGLNLFVNASGVGTLNYQWMHNGSPINGATAPTFSIASVTPADAGSYRCAITTCNTVNSAAAAVTVDRVPPKFSGLAAAGNGAQASCLLNLSWSPAVPGCSTTITYDVFRSTVSGFTPVPANRIATGVAGTGYMDDLAVLYNTPYYYVVRAVDALGNGDLNVVEKRGVATGPVSASTFTETFEGAQSGGGFDNAGWSHAALNGTVDWLWNTAQSQSPAHSWLSASQPAIADRVLISPALGILDNTTVSFWHTRAFEGSPAACYDGGTLELSTNGGASWNSLPAASFTTGGYDGAVAQGYGNPLAGKPAWCGGAIGAMTRVDANLGAFAGQSASLRWHGGEDISGAGAGWYVDTVTVANNGTAVSCTPVCHAPNGVANNSATDISACYSPGIRVDWNLPSNWGDYSSGGRTIRVLRDGVPIPSGGCSAPLPTATTCTDTTVVYPQTYSYQVRITNSCGMDVLTAGASAAVLTGGTPAGFGNNTATDVTQCAKSGVEVTWTLPTDWGDAPGSNHQITVLRNGGSSGCATPSSTQTSCTATAVVEGFSYFYTVRFTNSCGRYADTSGASAADFDNRLVPDWSLQSPATTPPARYRHGMAYHGSSNRTIVFGGNGYSGGVRSDTWAWNGSTWAQLVPQNIPSARMDFDLVADEARNTLLLYGGYNGSVASGETWIWDGINWVQKFPSNSPGPRSNHAMAYDPIRREIVLFGGNGGTMDDTWVWDGVNWMQRFPANAPSARTKMSMAFDRQQGVMLLYGGYSIDTTMADTWQWNGVNWTQLLAYSNAGYRSNHSLSYSEVLKSTVLFGYSYSGTQPDWYWSNANWQSLDTTNEPPDNNDIGLAYDTAKQETILYGNGLSSISNTWLLKAPIVSNFRLARNAAAGTLLSDWTAVPRATDYNLYQDVSPGGSFTQLTASATGGATNLTVPMPSGSIYFKVAAANICNEGPK